MSVIASKWAYSQSIKNPTAKNILAFIASHNFPGNKVFFSVQTISGATAFSRRAVIDALKWLIESKYLLKEVRIGEDGGQQSNIYTLNIPSAYVEQYCSDYTKLSTSSVQELHGGGAGAARGGVQELHPNNNIINNNINNKLLVKNGKKEHKVVDNLTAGVISTPLAKKKDWKKANEQKPAWAEKPKEPARADVTKQSTSYDASKYVDTPPFDPNAPGYQTFINSNSALRRKYQRLKDEARGVQKRIVHTID